MQSEIADSRPPQRILVRGLNWLGDAVMSAPALQRLREARPKNHLTLLTPEKLKDLWTNHPAINSVLAFPEDESIWSVGRRLRREKFDLGLVLPNSPRSALELWLAGIPQRVGAARPWRNLFLTRSLAPRPAETAMRKRSADEIRRLVQEPPAAAGQTFAPGAHHLHHYLHLAAALGASPEPLPPFLTVPEEALRRFTARPDLGGGPTATAPWHGLNAGAEYGPAKRWPEDRFAEAAIQIQRRTGCRWLIFGLQSDRELAARIAANISRSIANTAPQPPVVNLAGSTSLGELCAALKLCRVLLTNDSGPMHVAAALGTPVVVPFGSTSPELTGPGFPGDPRHACLRANAPCSPCFLRECPIDFRCMTGITVDRVVAAVLAATEQQTSLAR